MNVKFFDWDCLHLTALMKETYFSNLYLVRGGKGGALIENEGLADKLLRLVFGEGTIGICLI